jgi:hypothetical protein
MPKDQNAPAYPSSPCPYSFTPELEAKIAAIDRAGIVLLREIWRRELGTEPPKIRAYGILKRILAWRVQEKYLGGFSKAVQQQLDRLVAALDRDPKGDTAALRLKPGMVLVREWKGTRHQVLVRHDGFEHQGTTYASLSKVASTIAGARWSGPLFFGLKRRAEAAVGAR